jgi:hypothetical protein
MPDLDFISVSLGYTCGIGIYHMIVSTVFNREDSLY